MMKIKRLSIGIGLIEVLIALIVVSLGILAIVSLQGDLLLSSGETKARNEARLIAEQKLEELRGLATLEAYNGSDADEFLGLCSGNDEIITGKNASFTRTCDFEDLSPAPRAVTIEISWEDKTGPQVLLMNSEIVWADPTTGVLFASATEEAAIPALAPSPNANSSILGGGDLDVNSSSSPILPSDDSAPELANFANIYQGFDSEGNRVVFDNDTGEVLLTCFGHVVHSVSGFVYTTQDKNLNNIDMDVSQYGVCRFDSGTGQTARPYACFFCGNCAESWGQVDEDGNPVCTIQNGGTPSAEDIQAYDDNGIGPGGWRGRIGLDGLDTGGQGEQVCFNERILDRSSPKSTAREYRTIRSTTPESSEGINQSFLCHNFLLVNAAGGSDNKQEPDPSCLEGAEEYEGVAKFATMRIERSLAANDPNTVLGTDSSSCVVLQLVDVTISITNISELELGVVTFVSESGGNCADLGYDAETNIQTWRCSIDSSNPTATFKIQRPDDKRNKPPVTIREQTVVIGGDPPTANPDQIELDCDCL